MLFGLESCEKLLIVASNILHDICINNTLMSRLASLSILIIYVSLSVGIHVDIDTCCKTIAGLSFFSGEQSHEMMIADDCCQVSAESCCTTEDHAGQEGCESDCVYLQVLSEEQMIAQSTMISAQSLELISVGTIDDIYSIETSAAHEVTTYRGPPEAINPLPLYLFYQASLTYG